jgi:two-component system chemotaxis response regulator CheY
MKVMVVDDISTMRRIVRNALNEVGLTLVEEAENGQEALAKMKMDHFGLVVSDWNMPVMSGLDLLRAIRADAELKSIPVLMVASPAQKEHLMEAVRAGANTCVMKPFTPEALQEKINSLFE